MADQLKSIVVQNLSTKVSDEDALRWTCAAAIQLREHIAPLWNIKPISIAFYSKDYRPNPTPGTGVVNLVDNDGDDKTAGYHADLFGYPFGLVDVTQAAIPSRSFSHEIGEMAINPHMNLFYPCHLRTGQLIHIAGEICDPVKPHSYTIDADLQGFGESKPVIMSNFVTPAWFNGTNSLGPYDYLRKLASPFEMAKDGGYASVSDGTTVGSLMADRSTNPHSRTVQLRNLAV